MAVARKGAYTMSSGDYKLFCTKCDAKCTGYGNSTNWWGDCIICEIYGNGRSFMEGFKIL